MPAVSECALLHVANRCLGFTARVACARGVGLGAFEDVTNRGVLDDVAAAAALACGVQVTTQALHCGAAGVTQQVGQPASCYKQPVLLLLQSVCFGQACCSLCPLLRVKCT